MLFFWDLVVGVAAFFIIRWLTSLDGWSLVTIAGLIVCFLNVFLIADA